MKRIALLGFIIIGLPIIFTACCFCGSCSDIEPWSYTAIESSLQNDSSTIYHEGDTINSDNIYASILLKSEFSMIIPKRTSVYSAVACGKTKFGPEQSNPIFEWVFKLAIEGDILNSDTIPRDLIELKVDNLSFNWLKDKNSFINHFNAITTLDKFEVRFPSLHNSKNIQLVIFATKGDGSLMKAISQKVFCK